MTTPSECQGDYVHNVMFNTSTPGLVGGVTMPRLTAIFAFAMRNIRYPQVHWKMPALRNGVDTLVVIHIIRLTYMKRREAIQSNRADDVKAEVLRQQGALHPHPEVVSDDAFREGEFFDPRDRVQVRYEMLRRRQVDGDAVTKVANAFGVSRQAYYATEAAFAEKGISGLLPRQRGPRRAHKCTNEILDFVEQGRAEGFPDKEISEAVQKRFGVSIHPRSLVRALLRREKKQR